MTISEMMRDAKECTKGRCARGLHLRLSNDTPSEIDFIHTKGITVSRDYNGDLDILNKFPHLRTLHISKNITPEDLSKLDLSTIENLYVNFDHEIRDIIIDVPCLKRLTIYISENETDQLSIFDSFPSHIDIGGCSKLEELGLRHCTGYKLIDCKFDSLTHLICADCKGWDFAFLKNMPELSHFVATGCKLSDVSFLKGHNNLTHIDLTYNNISNANVLFELKGLSEVSIYKNPLENPDKYHSLPCSKVYATDKDYEFAHFLASVHRSSNLAFLAILHYRTPDPKRPALIQRMYDRDTDEDLFARGFASNVKSEIEHYTSPEKNYFFTGLLKKEELQEYILREYPFVKEYWR